jgi:hypothetical protein
VKIVLTKSTQGINPKNIKLKIKNYLVSTG